MSDERGRDATPAGAGGDTPECAAGRDALAAEPHARPAPLAAHLSSCEACARYAADMQALDAKIRRALAVRVPPATPLALDEATDDDAPRRASDRRTDSNVTPLPARRAEPSAPRRTPWLRGFALAAGVAGVALLATLLWTGAPRDSLASDLVAHMPEEPDAWRPNPAVPASALAYVLGRAGVRLDAGVPEVTYAHSCYFRGNFVPHLAVRTPQGAVTVLVLPRETARGRTEFAENGYRGVIVPAERGALAVLARDVPDGSGRVDDATLDAVAARVGAAVRYVDDARPSAPGSR